MIEDSPHAEYKIEKSLFALPVVRWTLIGVAVVVIAAAAWLMLQPHPPAQITQAAKNVSFPVYYPKQLPDGYALDEKSVSYKQDVVLFSWHNKVSGNQIVVSEQPRPNLDFNTFYHEQTRHFQAIVLPIGGDAIIGDDTTTTLVSATTSETWVIMRGPVGASDAMRAIATAFQSVNN